MPPEVSVVVPFYNEEGNVEPLAKRVAEVFAQMPGTSWECVLVNDGSHDGTRAALERVAAADPEHVRAVHLVRNSGQSAALIAGMRRAAGAYVLTLDGDLQNDPGDFPVFLGLLKEYDCVCGYRANRKDTWFRRFSSRVANRVRDAILHDGVRDSGCGSKGFRREVVEHFIPFNGQHRFFPVLVRAAGYSIVETPVQHHPRTSGVSKYGLNNRLWRGIYDLIGVSWLRRRYVPFQVEGE